LKPSPSPRALTSAFGVGPDDAIDLHRHDHLRPLRPTTFLPAS
jgi:hypothetical protein